MSDSTLTAPSPSVRKDRTHWLYLAVIVAVVLGILVGLAGPRLRQGAEVARHRFVSLIKMMISPVIFCTIVLGIGSVRKAASVGQVGGLALGYFLVMSTFALAIGLVVGNLIHPGTGLDIHTTYKARGRRRRREGRPGRLRRSASSRRRCSRRCVGESVLSTLFVALLSASRVQAHGPHRGAGRCAGSAYLQKLVFQVLAMIMWVAPIGAFGAIAGVVGETGLDALKNLAMLMVAFYITCALFVFVRPRAPCCGSSPGLNIFTLLRYLGREFLLIVSTSSSESALPRLIAKMEHLGVDRPSSASSCRPATPSTSTAPRST